MARLIKLANKSYELILDLEELAVMDKYGIMLEDHINEGFFKHRKVQLEDDLRIEHWNKLKSISSEKRQEILDNIDIAHLEEKISKGIKE